MWEWYHPPVSKGNASSGLSRVRRLPGTLYTSENLRNIIRDTTSDDISRGYGVVSKKISFTVVRDTNQEFKKGV